MLSARTGKRALGVHCPRAEPDMNCRRVTCSIVTLVQLAVFEADLIAGVDQENGTFASSFNRAAELTDGSVFGPVSEPPRLTINYAQGNAIIAWPLTTESWVLEQSPDLASSMPWTRVPLDL